MENENRKKIFLDPKQTVALGVIYPPKTKKNQLLDPKCKKLGLYGNMGMRMRNLRELASFFS